MLYQIILEPGIRIEFDGYQVVVIQRAGTVTRLYSSVVSWGLNLTGYQVVVIQRAAFYVPL